MSRPARSTPLRAVVAATGAFGAAMALFPDPVRQGFSWLIYSDPARIDGFGPDAVAYVTLAHGVMGALMLGWAVALWLALRPVPPTGLRVVAASVSAWYVLDTGVSLALGFGANAALNTGFALAFAAAWALSRRAKPP